MAAGIAVFAERNYRVAGVAEIARRAGVTEPVLYRHFSGKLDLFCQILDHIGRRIIEHWEAAVAGAPDALAAMRAAGEVYFVNAHEHVAESTLQFQALAETQEPAIAAVLATNHARYVRFFADLVRRGQREGTIRGDLDADAVAWLLNGVGVTSTMRGLLEPDTALAADRQTMLLLLDWLALPLPSPPLPPPEN